MEIISSSRLSVRAAANARDVLYTSPEIVDSLCHLEPRPKCKTGRNMFVDCDNCGANHNLPNYGTCNDIAKQKLVWSHLCSFIVAKPLPSVD